MKFLLTLALAVSAAAQAPKTIVKVVELSGTATVQFAEPNEWGYRALELDIPAGHAHISLRNPVKCRDRGNLDSYQIAGMRLTSSRCIYTGKYTEGNKIHTLLLMLGQGGITYPDAPENVVIIGFNAKGQPYKILELDAFAPIALADSPSGTHIAGAPDSSEGLCTLGPGKPNVTTYDPRAVYTLDATGHAKLDPVESEAYNREHYVWFGSKPDEKIMVFFNLPGHSRPYIPSTKEAEVLMTRYCKSEGH